MKPIMPLNDSKIPRRLWDIADVYRRMANACDMPSDVAVCYRVQPDFNLKLHGRALGECEQMLTKLDEQGVELRTTFACHVFWVPHLIPGTDRSMHVDRQRAALREIREDLDLPEQHLAGFGDLNILAGLILTHSKLMKSAQPLESKWCRTETLNAKGHHLLLGYINGNLTCQNWVFGNCGAEGVGVFPFGMEAPTNRNKRRQ